MTRHRLTDTECAAIESLFLPPVGGWGRMSQSPCAFSLGGTYRSSVVDPQRHRAWSNSTRWNGAYCPSHPSVGAGRVPETVKP